MPRNLQFRRPAQLAPYRRLGRPMLPPRQVTLRSLECASASHSRDYEAPSGHAWLPDSFVCLDLSSRSTTFDLGNQYGPFPAADSVHDVRARAETLQLRNTSTTGHTSMNPSVDYATRGMASIGDD
jgi:hypothetical protein